MTPEESGPAGPAADQESLASRLARLREQAVAVWGLSNDLLREAEELLAARPRPEPPGQSPPDPEAR